MPMSRIAALFLLTACPTLPGIEDAGSDAGADAGRPPAPAAIDVAAGSTHACARMADGTVRCWGCYCSGGLLQALTADALPVTIPGVRDAKQLALGLDTTCALLADGKVKCWGRGGAGQLGNGATADSDDPVEVAGLTAEVLEISAGDRHACARLGDGTTWCWGDNRERQLGDGTLDAQKESPSSLGVIGATQLELGKTHSCARRASGTVLCWGENAQGQLGDGTMMARNAPTPVQFGMLSGRQVAAGRASCLLRDDRGVSCWGDGDVLPVERFSADGGWAEVALGGVQACARRTDTVDCLDAGTVSVPGAVQLAAGERFTCARTDGGAVWCWGKNDVGQLGDGRQGAGADSDVPVKVGF